MAFTENDRRLVVLMAALASVEEDIESLSLALYRRDQRGTKLRGLEVEYQEDAAEAEGKLAVLTAAWRDCEAEICSLEAALVAKRGQTLAMGGGRQTEAWLHEIKMLAACRDRAENNGLELLEELERVQKAVARLAASLAQQTEQAQEEMSRLNAGTADAVIKKAALEAECSRLIQQLPAAVRRHVVRLRGQGLLSVVRVVKGGCGGCGTRLSTQGALDADKGRRLVRCPQCTRYVVHEQWSE